MGKYSGTDFSVLLVDGYNLAPAVMDSASMADEQLSEQTNPFGVNTEAHTPIGIKKGMLVAGGGIYDSAVDALHHALGTVVGISRIVCAAIYGNVPGRSFIGYEGAYTQKVETLSEKDKLTKANVTYLVSGRVDPGVIVQDHATFTADWDTKTGGAGATDTPVDNVALSGNRQVPITSNSVANPSVVTTTKPHGLTTGQVVVIAGVSGSTPDINGSRTVTVISTTQFSVPVNVTVGGTGGTVTPASTVNGGVGYAQCSAFSGFSGCVLKIRHSPDDVTYADLITFTTITAIGAQRQTVAGTVDRYLCSSGDVTGSGSITVFSGFSRN